MNVLLLGSGGREHALALALSRSPKLGRLVITPGNPGTAAFGQNESVPLNDGDGLLALARRERIDLVVVGPEAPLVDGLGDRLATEGFKVFGPSQAAAQLEGSKSFTKEFCREFGIPTAAYATFTDVGSATRHARHGTFPVVIKADGLAAGKGVIIAENAQEAIDALEAMFAGQFGTAGTTVVIEEFLQGEELSFFALCDGTRALAFASAQDHKRVGDGDTGLNTGGMGAISPAPLMTPDLEADIMTRIIEPTLRGMAARGTPFQGVLFAGLMVGPGGPKLIEYNVRFGDPEAEVILPRLEADLLSLLAACAEGQLTTASIQLRNDVALGVVMAARGYPEDPKIGTSIGSLDAAARQPGVTVFHAGTKMSEGRLVSAGGRVLVVTALARTATEAQARAYAAVDAIDWPGGFCRRDIGWRAVAREQSANASFSD